jgi:diguanylate cyclase (GGDEF)-like protein
MADTDQAMPASDHDDQRFWAEHVRISTVLYALCCGAIFAYVVTTLEQPRRVPLAAVTVLAVFAAAAFDRSRWHTVRSRHRMVIFYAWSCLTLALIAVASWLDGGASSPLCLMLFLALYYVALAYPPRAVLALSAAAVVTYLLLALGGDRADGTARVLVTGTLIGLSGFLGALAARNRWAQVAAQRHLSDTLTVLAAMDHLTGCLNRRAFDARLAAEVERAHRHGHPLSILVIDVDNFKSINDTYGHLAGDTVLGQVSSDMGRSIDTVGRLGGDEFAVILPHTSRSSAVTVAERLRDRVRCVREPAPVTLSIGAAELDVDAASAPGLVRSADLALYVAKSAGRDRVGVRAVEPGVPAPLPAFG